jgi:hypothetical protein
MKIDTDVEEYWGFVSEIWKIMLVLRAETIPEVRR